MTLDDYLQKLEVEKRLIKSILFNEELMEHLNSTIRWLLHYCEKNDIRPPNLDILSDAIERSQDYIQKISPDQPISNINKTIDKVTEPNFDNPGYTPRCLIHSIPMNYVWSLDPQTSHWKCPLCEPKV